MRVSKWKQAGNVFFHHDNGLHQTSSLPEGAFWSHTNPTSHVFVNVADACKMK